MYKSIEEIMTAYSKESENLIKETKPWQGFRELVLVDKVKECDDIMSFYFKALDGEKLVKHVPGQFLPIKIKSNDVKYNNQIRTYSLSMVPNECLYRISVKRIGGGLISSYLHDKLNVKDKIEAMIPTGLFTLSKENMNKPIVLISAGIGITPLISMLYYGADKVKDITFIQAVQNSKIQPFNYDIQKIRENTSLKSYVFYSDPLEGDIEGDNYDVKGFVTKSWIENNLSLDSEFYFCGPPIFMKNINKALIELGVNRNNIHFEFFGEPQEME